MGVRVRGFLTSLCIAVAMARYRLEEYWRARVTLKEDHRIIRTGPYARVRHPIYTRVLLATMGTAMVIGEWDFRSQEHMESFPIV